MWQKNVRYLDYNASSGISPRVRQKLSEVIASDLYFANPTSRHRLGQKVRHLLFDAQFSISKSLGVIAQDDELIFTASGTEANQTVLRSLATDVDTLIIGAGEHSASHDLLTELKSTQVVELPLLRSGAYDFEALSILLAQARTSEQQKIGISLFWANNETGVITDLEKLASILEMHAASVILHLDGAQAWGKIPFDLSKVSAHFVTFSAHKIGAPAGTGVIYKKAGVKLHPLITGTQSHGLRGGTENMLGLIATAVAADALDAVLFTKKTAPLIEKLEAGLLALSSPIKIWGSGEKRVSNTTRFSFSGFKAYENWVELLDLKGFAVSHGSACKAQVIEPSRVLLNMGAAREEALNSVRVSFGPENTEADVADFLIALKEVLATKMQGSAAEKKA